MHSDLWTLDALAAAAGGEVQGYCHGTFGGVSIDSRTVAAGDIFVAIKGDNMDGHDFVAAALQKVRALLLCRGADAAWPQNLPLAAGVG